jgi:hypothetical protein
MRLANLIVLALAAAIASTGCAAMQAPEKSAADAPLWPSYSTRASAPAIIARSTLRSSLALTPGLYCVVSFDSDLRAPPTGSTIRFDKEPLRYGDCVTVESAQGGLIMRSATGGAGRMRVANLARGAYLFQQQPPARGYALYVVRALDDAFALLPPPRMTESWIASAAPAHDVAIEAPPGHGSRTQFEITAGEPHAVHALMRNAAGNWFGAALRDPTLFHLLRDRSLQYVRFDADPREAAPDETRVRQRIERLRTFIRTSITLE